MIGTALFATAVLSFIWLVERWPRLVQRRKLERVAPQMWAVLESGSVWRQAEPSDHELVRRLENAVDETAELERFFKRLGDVVVGTGETATPSRVFGHADGIMLASLSVTSKGASITLESYTDSEEFETHRDKILSGTPFALPPISHHQYWPTDTPLERLIKAHQIYARFDQPERLIRIESLDEALLQFQKSSDRIKTWRCAQDPDTLLASDLRALFGDRAFERHGAAWMRRFKKNRAKLPIARTRRPGADRPS